MHKHASIIFFLCMHTKYYVDVRGYLISEFIVYRSIHEYNKVSNWFYNARSHTTEVSNVKCPDKSNGFKMLFFFWFFADKKNSLIKYNNRELNLS